MIIWVNCDSFDNSVITDDNTDDNTDNNTDDYTDDNTDDQYDSIVL